jgi:O-antigen ligase
MTRADLPAVDRADAIPVERATAFALAGLLLLATLGEGGGHPVSMMAWHGWLVGLLLTLTLLPRRKTAARRSLAAAPLTAFGLFLLLFALGALRAPYAYGALLVSIEVAACVAVAWIAASTGSRGLQWLVTPLQIGAAVQGIWVIAQWLVRDQSRPAGTFLNANHLALWMIAVSLFALGAARTGDGRSDVVRRLVLVAPAAVAVVLAGSRGAAIGLVAGAVWLLWRRWQRIPRAWRVGLVGAGVVVVGLVAGRQLVRIEQHDPFRHHRLKIWKASLAAVAESPLWGTGPGQFAAAAKNLSFPDGDGPLRFDRVFESTHSDALRLPVELGLPAALAALAALGLAVRSVASRRRAGSLPPLADGAIGALIAVAAHGLVDNPSHWPAVYLLASVLLGCLLSTEREESPRFALSARAALAGALLVVFYAADVAPFLAWREASRLPHGSLSETGRAGLQRALRWNPIHPQYWLRRAEDLAESGPRWGVDAYASAREAAEQAARLHPADARVLRGVARIEAHACRTLSRGGSCRDHVSDLYRRAEQLARHDATLPLELAGFLLDLGDSAGARRAAERALAIEPEAVLPRLLLAVVLVKGGTEDDLRRATVQLAEARERAKSWSDWNEGSYGRALLVPDPRLFARVERVLADAGGESPREPQVTP